MNCRCRICLMSKHTTTSVINHSENISIAPEKNSMYATMQSSTPLSAYLHIPFCERECIYCDFYSIENLSQRADFVDLPLREIDLKLIARPEIEGRELQTI